VCVSHDGEDDPVFDYSEHNCLKVSADTVPGALW
jgi:hypothetical protein